jgi:hypothetical protein
MLTVRASNKTVPLYLLGHGATLIVFSVAIELINFKIELGNGAIHGKNMQQSIA